MVHSSGITWMKASHRLGERDRCASDAGFCHRVSVVSHRTPESRLPFAATSVEVVN